MTDRIFDRIDGPDPRPLAQHSSSPVEVHAATSIDQGRDSESTPAETDVPFPIVGVGASAGGLEAVTQLLRALPADTGAGFVIVQHLAPNHASNMAEILSRSTMMSVCEVRDEPEVVADHVYVVPPGRDMIIAGGKLRLLPQDRYGRRRGIDQFFSSLAEDCGHKAIGVVLSGAMNDGTLGLEAIKAAGGITFAQNASAQNDSMPRSAVASGCVDFVLPPDEIAAEIARIATDPYVVPTLKPESTLSLEPARHANIVAILHRALGVDFTHYKKNTLLRRITRRMVLHKMATIKDYEDYLRRHPDEIEALFQDILIGVTTFFRDPETFDVLKDDLFPKLIAGRTRQDPLRIWTLGCSTGEEAYSIAMVFAECAEDAGSDIPMQIFATDLNSSGVAKARTGVYSSNIEHHVSPERLQRFFTREGGGYRICKDIRERCIFSRHNVLGDPPFSRVDLISCRNLLIYMEPVLQQQIMALLHYALKPGGRLWLGRSETAGASRALFDVEDARNKIFVRRPGASAPGLRFRPALGGGTADPFLRAAPIQKAQPRADLHKEAERILLARYAPPGVVISPAMEIVEFRGDNGPYLAPPTGPPSVHLLKMLREGLLVGVRAAILCAGAEGRIVREERLRVKSDDGFREVTVEVIPIKAADTKQGGFLVLFHELGAPHPGSLRSPEASTATTTAAHLAAINDEEIVRLNQELAATREYLQVVIEQQETANEELQSANEEAQSANEEMQSVNEELETSKEEIQSSNEELATVNDELNSRNSELSRLNSSLQLARDYAESIVSSMRSPLVVLDAGLRVKAASAAFYETFHVDPVATEGRLIYDLGNGQWNIAALRTLLEELLPRRRQIDDYEVRHTFETIGARIMVLNAQRLAPAAEHEPLMILAIEDITNRTKSDENLRDSQARLRHAADAAGLTYVEIDFGLGRLRPAENFAAVMGYELPPGTSGDAVSASRLLLDHVVPLDRTRVEAALRELLNGAGVGKIVYRVRGDDQIERYMESVWSIECGSNGKPIRAFATNLDISEIKRTEEHNQLLMAEVNHRANNLLAVVQAVARQTAKHADPATFMARLSDRIDGLTTSQDLLVKNNWEGVEILHLVEGQLAHFSDLIGHRVLILGAPGRLKPAAAQGIGMALHELATNASKYGALSNNVGRVHITWQVTDAPKPMFTIRWLEEGGPKVEPPTRKGFGQMVIGRMVERAVDGVVEFDYRESGFTWMLSAPVAATMKKGRSNGSAPIARY